MHSVFNEFYEDDSGIIVKFEGGQLVGQQLRWLNQQHQKTVLMC